MEGRAVGREGRREGREREKGSGIPCHSMNFQSIDYIHVRALENTITTNLHTLYSSYWYSVTTSPENCGIENTPNIIVFTIII